VVETIQKSSSSQGCKEDLTILLKALIADEIVEERKCEA
jgi:hypothetical protein